MKLVIQRVTRAAVEVEGAVVGKIGAGLLLLLGIEHGDTKQQAEQLATKVLKARLWADPKDPAKAWSASVADSGYEILVVSQFTLFATFKKPKPDFKQAMGGDTARHLYEEFVQYCKAKYQADKVATGIFGAMMQVSLCNDGPVTVELIAEPDSNGGGGGGGAGGGGGGGASPSKGERGDGGRGGMSPVAGQEALKTASAADLETLLHEQPYVGGFTPSQLDRELFERFSTNGGASPSPSSASPNFIRWLEHVGSYTSVERALWT